MLSFYNFGKRVGDICSRDSDASGGTTEWAGREFPGLVHILNNRGRTVVFMRARVLHSWVVHIKK